MEFYNINKDNYNAIKLFLTNVPSIKDVDEEVVNNAVIAMEGNKIIGCISYEAYDHKGLIRYFIFKNIPKNNVFNELFDRLQTKVKNDGITEIIGIASDLTTKELFSTLGFIEIENKKIFLDESLKSTTQFQSAIFMSKSLFMA